MDIAFLSIVLAVAMILMLAVGVWVSLTLVGVGILGLFSVFAWRGLKTGLRAPDVFGRYLAWGLTGVLVLQALIHMSVALALMPTKGIPLPFISYGGSSLVVSLAACGLLLNISQHG